MYEKLFALNDIIDPDSVRIMVYNGDRVGHAPLQSILNLVSVAPVSPPGSEGSSHTVPSIPSGGGSSRPIDGGGQMSESGGCSLGKTFTLVIPENGVGDMRSVIYDPTCVSKDAFDMDSMKEGKEHLILTTSEREKISSIDDIKSDITSTKDSITEIREISKEASTTSTQAKNIAEAANSQSQEALTQSIQAIDTANTAKTNSDDAIRVSGEAKSDADKAIIASRDASTNADRSITIANEAKRVADAAQKSCDDNSQKISDLTPKVGEANTKAEKAQETADRAVTESTEAKQAITEAKQAFDEKVKHISDDVFTKIRSDISNVDKCCKDNSAKIQANSENIASNLVKIEDVSKKASDVFVKVSNIENEVAETKQKQQMSTEFAEKANMAAQHAIDQAVKAIDISEDSQHVATRAEEQIKILNFYTKKNTRGREDLQKKAKELDEKIKQLNEAIKSIKGESLSLTEPFLKYHDPRVVIYRAYTGLSLDVGGSRYIYCPTEDIHIDIHDSLNPKGSKIENGKDYYVYLTRLNDEFKLVVSSASTFPDGYNEDNSRKIGGFHTLCVDAGELRPNLRGTPHPLNGMTAGSVLPNSVWCLNHRPCCSAEGMVYNPLTNFWIDIYLQSGTGLNTRSMFGGKVTNKRSHDDHEADFSVNRKFLPDRIMYVSSVPGIQISRIWGKTSDDFRKQRNLTTGGNYYNLSGNRGQRMISSLGIEDICGYFFQKLRDVVYITTKSYFSGAVDTMRASFVGGGSLDRNIPPCHTLYQTSISSPEPFHSARGCSPERTLTGPWILELKI